MNERDEDIALLEAEAQIEKEWAEFEAEYLANRTEDGNETGTSGRTDTPIQGNGQ